MRKTLKEIALLVGGEIVGDDSAQISSVNGIREAQEGDITFLANPMYRPLINITKASAIITSRDITSAPRPIIRTDDPSAAFAKVLSLFGNKTDDIVVSAGIHKTAVIGENVRLGAGISVGAFAVIEDNCEIGDAAVLCAHAYIGNNCRIGGHSKIYPHVTIREGSVIGANVIIHSNTVIGSDGFGYVQVNGEHQKIPQTGIVCIEDNVEIGANVAIDRARFGKTLVGRGTKIDNLVQIAHNVCIGENSIIVSQAGISGSSRLGKNVILAGQSGIVGHIELGDNVIVAAQSGVTKSVPANSIVLGSPAYPMTQQKKIFALLHKLPDLFKTIKELKDKML
jgi:UDP-3-O-[3-hydroxymyristoyl] glucosamine N-acyltransferase